jgi:glutaredoxin
MKLYHSTASPSSRRVRMFTAEKGISIPLQLVNLGEKEQFSDGFKEINPRQQVPVLVLDDGHGDRRSPCNLALSREGHGARDEIRGPKPKETLNARASNLRLW